jgi:nucleotide-binding universal stress UspA family protein
VIRRILVPLDGTDLAEVALPAAAALAGRLGATVSLVHLLEKRAPRSVHGRPHLAAAGDAEAYLAGVAARGFPPGVKVETHVHAEGVGSVARSITEHAELPQEAGGELIVMSAHGGRTTREALLGALAQRVSARGRTPVLVVRAGAKPDRDVGLRPGAAARAGGFRLGSLLVPLDRDPGHAGALEPAAELAAAFGAKVHLLVIVPTFGTLSGRWVSTGRFLPGTTARLLDLSVSEEREFLAERTAALRARGLQASAEVARGDPARAIAGSARRLKPDLIVLGTHGRSGWEAVWEGSVASKVFRRCRQPLLLVPVLAPAG